MNEAAEIGATGMRAHQAQIDTIAQNVANVNTVGFRRSVVTFAEVSAAITAASTGATADEASAPVRGRGALAQLSLSSTGGEIRRTDATLDIAIEGEGFLGAVRADGTPVYTRGGSLKINGDGLLSVQSGA